ncbi:fibronectin type III domain-containing protein [Legionella bozemanae]
MNNLLIVGMVLLSSLAYAKMGLLFKITQSGAPAAVDVILCLNGKGPLSCQNYHVSAQDLRISTTASHQYPAAGIKVLTPGYNATGCTPYSNGYCLFVASNTTAAMIHLNSSSQKQNQTITFTMVPPSSAAYNSHFTVAATASSGLPVTLSSSGACTNRGGTYTMTSGTGACTVIANQPGNLNYNAAPTVTSMVAASLASQVPLTASASPSTIAYNGTSTLSTSGGSGMGAVTYAVTSGTACSISGSTLTGVGVGSCQVTATKARDVNYQPVTSGPITITVNATIPDAPSGVTSSAGVSNTEIDVSWRQPVNTGGSPITGYMVTSSGGQSCTTTGATICTVSGLTNGTPYTFSVTATNVAGTSSASLSTSALAPFSLSSNQTVPSAPRNVTAVAGDGQVTLTWSPPQNYGGEVITGYTVGSTPASSGCTLSGSGISTPTTCTVSGLTNGASYVFTVTASNSVGTAPYLLGYSRPVTPMGSTATPIVANPSVLTLSANGQKRTIQVINNSTTEEVITGIDTSALDALGATVTINTCTNATLVANGGSCFIEIQPGPTVSTYTSTTTPCTSIAPAGTALTPSPITISTSSSSTTTDVYVVSYGCQYQGGYLFAMDDTTPVTGSIGGTVAATGPQSTGIVWSPSLDIDSIWGIDNVSTIAIPDPNGASTQAATLNSGQLNCNGMSEGACNSNNILVMGYSGSYAAGLCTQPWSNSGASCIAGTPGCYTDWYLPSICEMDASPSCPSGTQSMQSNVSSFLQPTTLFWSSTEFALNPRSFAWIESFSPGSSTGSQSFVFKGNPSRGAWCVRGLTN